MTGNLINLMSKYFYILVLLLQVNISFGQTYSILNQKLFGGSKDDNPINFIKTNDGGFVVIATSESSDSDLSGLVPASNTKINVVVFKVDSLLSVVWKRAFTEFTGCSSILASVNEYIFIGRYAYDSYSVRIDQNGNLISKTHLGKADGSGTGKSIRLQNGNLAFISEFYTNGFGVEGDGENNEAELLIFDPLGNLVLRKLYGGVNNESPIAIFQEEAGNIVFFANTESHDRDVTGNHLTANGDPSRDIWMVKLNPDNGDIVYQRCIGGAGKETLISACRLSSGDYAMVLSYDSNSDDIELNSYNCCDIGVFRVDLSGNIQWQRPTFANAYSTITEDVDGELLLVSGNSFIRFSGSGTQLWSTNISGYSVTSFTRMHVFTDSANRLFILHTRTTSTPGYTLKNVSLLRLNRTPSRLAIRDISKNWLCQNESFVLKIDTSGYFAPDNVFTVKISTSNQVIILGQSSNTTLDLTGPVTNGSNTIDYSIYVVSSNPVFQSGWCTLKVQSPVIPVITVPDTVFRGTKSAIGFRAANYSDGPHSLLINDTWTHTMTNLGTANIKFPSKTTTYTIVAYKNLCGTVPLNITKTLHVKEKSRSDLKLPPSIIWEKTYGGKRDEFSASIVPSINGTFWITGYTSSSDGDIVRNTGYKHVDQREAWIARIDENGNILFKRTISGENGDFIFAACAAPDGGVAVVGKSASTRGDFEGKNSIEQAWVMKIDANGQTVWNNRFMVSRQVGIPYQSLVFAIEPTNDGGYGIAGSIDNKFGIVKLDQNGNQLWLTTIGNDNSLAYRNCAYDITEDAAGNLYAVGTMGNIQAGFKGGEHDAFFVKTSASGQILINRFIGGQFEDNGTKIAVTDDGGCIILGSSNSTNGDMVTYKGGFDVFLIKLSANGTTEWFKSYGTRYEDRGFGLLPTTDGYLITGHQAEVMDLDLSSTSLYETSHSNLWAFKVDFQGKMSWQRVMGGFYFSITSFQSSATRTPNGDYLILTTTQSGAQDVSGKKGGSDLWLVRLSGKICERNLELTQTLTGESAYFAQSSITATNKIETGANIIYSAPNGIIMKPGFEVKQGSIFRTERVGCP